jgi:cytochrome c-type biogenesis protein CcmH/NrfG
MTHSNLGNILFQKGRVDEAIAHYKMALEVMPTFAQAHYNLGNILLQREQVGEAISHFQKALEIHPDFAEVHGNLGWIFLQQGRVDEAIAHFQKVLELQPGDAMAHNNLASALLQKGQVREAIAHYQTVLELQPNNARALSDLAWVLASCPEASIRNGLKAIELAKQANQLSGGQDPTMLCTLAAAYAEGGRFAEAITVAQEALLLATAHNNAALVNTLRAGIELYQAGTPFRDPSLTATPAHLGEP